MYLVTHFFVKLYISYFIPNRATPEIDVPKKYKHTEIPKKPVVPQASEENIRRHLLKRVIHKKTLSGKDCKTDYGDATISSDENSDCCSEPMNETEDLIIDEDSEINDTSKEKASRNIESTSSSRPPENPSGSLQNVHEITSEVIISDPNNPLQFKQSNIWNRQV